MAARGAADAKRAQRVRIGRATGSHSVDRSVGLILVCSVFGISTMGLSVDPKPLEP
jgi:hypothetical protein